MEKLYNAICWIAVGVLAIFFLIIGLYRAVGLVGVTVWVIFFSSLPLWERILAPAAIISGLVFIMRRYGTPWGFTGTYKWSRRIPRNKNFAYYTGNPNEARTTTHPEAKER
jgi:hypothetical protein